MRHLIAFKPATMWQGVLFVLAFLCTIVHSSKIRLPERFMQHSNKRCQEWMSKFGMCPFIPYTEPECPNHLGVIVGNRESDSKREKQRVRVERLMQFVNYARDIIQSNRDDLVTQNLVEAAALFDRIRKWIKKHINKVGKGRGTFASEKWSRNPRSTFRSLVRNTCRLTFREGYMLRHPNEVLNRDQVIYSEMNTHVFNRRGVNPVKAMQNYCTKVILRGTNALETYLAPAFGVEALDVDIFEGSEFMFGADVCVAKRHQGARFKCCYQWRTQKPFEKREFYLFSQSKMLAHTKMGDSYGPHSWCGELYHEITNTQFFSVIQRFDSKSSSRVFRNGAWSTLEWSRTKLKKQPRSYRINPAGCLRWMKKYKDLSWVKNFNRATTCPCNIKIKVKPDFKNYAGPKKETIEEWCEQQTFCKEVDDFYISDQFHPGSDFCIRTIPGKSLQYMTNILDKDEAEEGSNQCCYGHQSEFAWNHGNFELIVSGTGAGTPDLGVGKISHAVADVVAVHECGVEEYLKLRPPFPGGIGGAGCKAGGLTSPKMLSELELVQDPLHAFVVSRKLNPPIQFNHLEFMKKEFPLIANELENKRLRNKILNLIPELK